MPDDGEETVVKGLSGGGGGGDNMGGCGDGCLVGMCSSAFYWFLWKDGGRKSLSACVSDF